MESEKRRLVPLEPMHLITVMAVVAPRFAAVFEWPFAGIENAMECDQLAAVVAGIDDKVVVVAYFADFANQTKEIKCEIY